MKIQNMIDRLAKQCLLTTSKALSSVTWSKCHPQLNAYFKQAIHYGECAETNYDRPLFYFDDGFYRQIFTPENISDLSLYDEIVRHTLSSGVIDGTNHVPCPVCQNECDLFDQMEGLVECTQCDLWFDPFRTLNESFEPTLDADGQVPQSIINLYEARVFDDEPN